MKEGNKMEEEQIRKTFRLIEPFLPEKVVEDFQHFIDESIELKQMYKYSSQMNEMLRESIQVLSKKIEAKEKEGKQVKTENLQLTMERDQALHQKYELEKEYQNENKQRLLLQKQNQELKQQLQSEKESYLLLIEKVAKDNQQLLLMLQKLKQRLKQSVPLSQYQKEVDCLKQEIKEKEQQLELMENKNEDLQMEYESYKERFSYAYQNGFQKAILYERKRKR